MLKMINQLIEPTDGNIYLNEKRIKEYQWKLRLETGYVSTNRCFKLNGGGKYRAYP